MSLDLRHRRTMMPFFLLLRFCVFVLKMKEKRKKNFRDEKRKKASFDLSEQRV